MNIPRKRLFWAVALGHAVNDVFMSMGPVLLAFLSSTTMGITNTQIGLAIGLQQLVGGFSQPVFGLRADRVGGRWQGALGVAWTVGMFAIAVLLVALTQNYWLFVVPFVLVAFGSGAFHPVGGMHAAESDPAKVATSVSWFFLMGQLGLAAGPLIAGRLLNAASENGTRDILTAMTQPTGFLSYHVSSPASLTVVLILTPLAIPVAYLMATTIPALAAHRTAHPPRVKSATDTSSGFSIPYKAGGLLLALVILRSLATPGSVSFIPVLFEQKGWSPAEYGMITSSFWIASGIAGVYFGGLADRFDRRYVLAGSMIACAPAFFLLPTVDGTLAFVLAIAAGGLSGGSHSLIVVLAQEMMPSGKAFATGMALGVIFGMGALGSLFIGSLADTVGLGTAFQVVAVAVTLSGFLSFMIPLQQRTLIPVPAPGD
ncbi:MAG: MFS transporter [Aggregatilineales bacterium]